MTKVTYPKMNKEIKVLLGSNKYNPINLYALARIEELETVLKTARSAIDSLDHDALGTDPDLGYGYREELLFNIKAALDNGE